MHVFGPETRVYRSDLKLVRQQLTRVPDDAPETMYNAANGRVIAAEQRLEWHQRIDIDLGLYDHSGDSDEF